MKILLTGSTRGIGKAIYDALKDEHDVWVIDRHEVRRGYCCDLSKLDSVTALCETIKDEKFDAVINNAGGSYPIAFEKLTLEDVVERMNLNFLSPVLIMQAVLPGMKDRKFGKIINISSVTAKTPVPYLHVYSAAKSALDSMTRSLAVYYADCNVCINSILPGSVDTQSSVEGRKVISELRGCSDEEYQDAMISNNGLGRLVRTDEVAQMVVYLLSDGGNCITGQRFNLCGNMEMN